MVHFNGPHDFGVSNFTLELFDNKYKKIDRAADFLTWSG